MEDRKRKIQAIEKLYENNGELLKGLCYNADMDYRKYFQKKELAETGMDIIQGIIDAMILGERKWDIEKYPDAYKQVLYYMRSEIRNLQSREKKMLDSLDIDSEKIKDIELINNKTKVTQDENLKQRELKEMFKKCLKHIEGNGSALQAAVFEGMYYGKSNIELALENNTEIREIENAKKRIKTRLHEKFPEYRIEI